MHKLRPAGYEQFLAEFCMSVPENYNFAFDYLDKTAAETPDRLAVVHVDNEGVRRDYTFEDLRLASNRLANALARLGVARGDRVMIILYRRIEFWVTMLALHKLGAVAVPSPSLLTEHDIEYRVGYAGITTVVCEDSITPRVQAAKSKCPTLKILIQAGSAPMPEGWTGFEAACAVAPESFTPATPRPGGKEALFVFFTSGTTGQPKMVEHRHDYPLAHYATGAYWHDLEPGDLHLTLADSGWAKAVWGKYYGQWLAGAAVFVWDFRGKFDPGALLKVIADNGVTTFCAPPTVYRFLIREDLGAVDLSKLRHCTTAGELLNESVFLAWKQATGKPIYEAYGQTETTVQIATYTFMEPKPGSIGKPSPGWKIVLLDESGAPCPTGEEGEICIDVRDGLPLGLFAGYMDEPEKTASVWHDGFYHTGDKAWVDEDGYFWFLGRVDDLIKSSGYRIGPFEVESALITHPAVIEAAVTGVPDPVRGQAVKATVVLSQGYAPSEALTRELQAHVKSVTAPYKYPRIIDYVEELPKTISGKIKRAEIRARDLAREI